MIIYSFLPKKEIIFGLAFYGCFLCFILYYIVLIFLGVFIKLGVFDVLCFNDAFIHFHFIYFW